MTKDAAKAAAVAADIMLFDSCFIRLRTAFANGCAASSRRSKSWTVPCRADAYLAGSMRKVDGWQSLAEKPDDKILDLAA